MAILISKLLEISPPFFLLSACFLFFRDLLFCGMPCPIDVCFLYAFPSCAERPQRQFSSFTLPHFSRVVSELCSFPFEEPFSLVFDVTALVFSVAFPFVSSFYGPLLFLVVTLFKTKSVSSHSFYKCAFIFKRVAFFAIFSSLSFRLDAGLDGPCLSSLPTCEVGPLWHAVFLVWRAWKGCCMTTIPISLTSSHMCAWVCVHLFLKSCLFGAHCLRCSFLWTHAVQSAFVQTRGRSVFSSLPRFVCCQNRLRRNRSWSFFFLFFFSPSWDLFSNSVNSCWGLDPLILGLSRWMLQQKGECDNTGPHKVAEVLTPLERQTKNKNWRDTASSLALC